MIIAAARRTFPATENPLAFFFSFSCTTVDSFCAAVVVCALLMLSACAAAIEASSAAFASSKS